MDLTYILPGELYGLDQCAEIIIRDLFVLV